MGLRWWHARLHIQDVIHDTIGKISFWCVTIPRIWLCRLLQLCKAGVVCPDSPNIVVEGRSCTNPVVEYCDYTIPVVERRDSVIRVVGPYTGSKNPVVRLRNRERRYIQLVALATMTNTRYGYDSYRKSVLIHEILVVKSEGLRF